MGMFSRGEFLKGAALSSFALLPFVSGGSVVDRPNILLILTDDQPFHTLYSSAMSQVQSRLIASGTDFTPQAYAIVPLCGPARVSLFTGKCPHNHHVIGNETAYAGYRKRGYPETDLIARVKASPAGYHTGYFGKLINGYGDNGGGWVHPYVDRWVALVGGQGLDPYRVNVDGDVRQETQNHTPFFGEKCANYIRSRSGIPQPFFAWLNWTDPHIPYTPLERFRHTHDNELYSSPGVEETDISDKSRWSREQVERAPLGEIQRNYEGTLEELEGVDLWVGYLLDALEETGQLENTVVIFTTDNGYMMGEHERMTKKNLPYEESSRVPLVIRGPGFTSRLASHLDIPATILDIAGADTSGLDGRSLLFGGPWRKRLLVEHPILGWYMLREGNYAYFELPSGESELYDLSLDPYELESLDLPDVKAELSVRLEALKSTGGEDFRAAEE